jgi:hypothetical protein
MRKIQQRGVRKVLSLKIIKRLRFEVIGAVIAQDALTV